MTGCGVAGVVVRDSGIAASAFGPPPRDDVAKVRPREKPSKAQFMLLPAFHADSFSCEIWRSVNEPLDQDAFPVFLWTIRSTKPSRKPTRKPRLLLRLPGVLLLRLAERKFVPVLFQEPPRLTRFEPDALVLRPKSFIQ